MALRITTGNSFAQIANPWTSGPITLCAWVWRSATTGRYLFGMIDTDDGASSEGSADPRVTVNTSPGSGGLATYFGSGSGISDVSTATYTTGTWFHLCAVFQGSGTTMSAVEVFINGVGTGTPGTSNRDLAINGLMDVLRIGNNSTTGSNFDCAHFAYFNAALTQSQITELQTRLPTALTGVTPAVYESFIGSAGAFALSGAAAINSTNDATLPSLSSGGATAITLTGPSSGTVGVASSAFTVGANGTITGTVTVTPSDGGDGGTFTPTSVKISSGSPTATFTYTAANAGTPTATITVTNNGSLTNPSGIAYSASAASTPISFSGTVSTASFTIGTAGSVNLAPFFAGSLTPFTFALDGASAALPSGVTLSSSGLLSWSGSGTAGTTTGVIVQGTDTGSNTADTNAFSIAITAPSNNIRLTLGIDWHRGAEFANQTVRHWSVWSADGTTLYHSGTSGTTDAGGVEVIDINGAAFSVGTVVKVYAEFHDGAANPLDRVVRYAGGYVVATAQV